MQIMELVSLLFLVLPCIPPVRFIVYFILVNAQLRYALSNLGFSGGKSLVRGVSFGFEDSSGGQSRRLIESCGHAERQLVRSRHELSFDMFLRRIMYFPAGLNRGRRYSNEDTNDNNCSVQCETSTTGEGERDEIGLRNM